MAETLIKISGVRKEYKVEAGPNVVALNGVDLEIKRNEFICVVGPSGCGKTTLLNIIAGLEPFDSGSVTMHGEEIIGPGPDRGVIFQQYALFPWMTVRRNIEYGLKFQEKMFTDEEKSELVSHYIKMVNLEGFENSYPKALSGGMKQRVAIARGYALNPEVLLMDEPTSALDPISTGKIEELCDQLRNDLTIVIVTHNMQQAARISDRTAFFLLGKVVEYGETEQIFSTPKNKKTEEYITGRFG